MSIKNTENLTWDLEKLLKNKTFDELKQKYFDTQNQIIEIYKKNPFLNKENFKQFHNFDLENSKISNRLFNYIFNHQNADLSDNKWFSYIQEIQHKSVVISQAFADFSNKAIENKEKIKEYLQDKNLSYLTRYYELIFKTEPHILSPEIKKFTATYAALGGSHEQVFTSLIDKELIVQKALDSKNKKHEIENYSKYIKLMTNEDRTLRKNAYQNWHNAISSIRESLAKLLYYHFLEENIDAKNCNFKLGYYESCIFSDEISEDFIPNIYQQIAKFTKHYKKYKKIQKKLIKQTYSLDQVKAWDMRMPVIKTSKSKVSIKTAKEWTKEALLVLGKDYIKGVNEAFEQRWIDWLPRKNKVSGAYCISGTYGLDCKYILMNYNNRIDDVYTLVHELGHALHAVEFTKSQTIYSSSSIFITEITSILNEMLLSFYLLKKFKNNIKQKIEIYDNLISGFFSTTLTQIIFSEWEYDINAVINEGGVMDANTAENLYYEKQKKYYGIKKKLNKNMKKSLSSILTVPHFYAGNFYLYKYAVGQIAAVITAYKIYEKGKNSDIIEKYFKFLASGSSLPNLDTLKIIDIDFKDEKLWKKVIQIVSGWIKEYDKLSKKI